MKQQKKYLLFQFCDGLFLLPLLASASTLSVVWGLEMKYHTAFANFQPLNFPPNKLKNSERYFNIK